MATTGIGSRFCGGKVLAMAIEGEEQPEGERQRACIIGNADRGALNCSQRSPHHINVRISRTATALHSLKNSPRDDVENIGVIFLQQNNDRAADDTDDGH